MGVKEFCAHCASSRGPLEKPPPSHKGDVSSLLAASPFPVGGDLLVVIFSAFQSPRSNNNPTGRHLKGPETLLKVY